MSNVNKDLLRKYLDTEVPEYNVNDAVDSEKNYPRFNDLVKKLTPVVDKTKKENYPYDIQEDNDFSVVPRSEVHPLHKMLKQAGMSQGNLKDTVMETNDKSSRNARDYENAMYKVLLQATNPTHLQNMKYSREMRNPYQKLDLLEDLNMRNSLTADTVTGVDRAEPASVFNGIPMDGQKKSLNGFYDLPKDNIIINLPTVDSGDTTYIHEGLHAKDYKANPNRQGSGEALGSAEFREKYGRLSPSSFSGTNKSHLDENIELEDPSRRAMPAAKLGTSAALYNKINKLLKDK